MTRGQNKRQTTQDSGDVDVCGYGMAGQANGCPAMPGPYNTHVQYGYGVKWAGQALGQMHGQPGQVSGQMPGQVPGQAFGQAGQAPVNPQGSIPLRMQGQVPPQTQPGTQPQTGLHPQPLPAYANGAGVYVPPATSVPKQVKTRKHGPGFWIAIVIAILCVVLAIVLGFLMFGSNSSRRAGDAGQLEGKTEAEIQAELDRQVEEGMFNISIASNVQFETGTREGDIRIENVPGNPYLMQVSIVRDDTGDEIYTTDMIEPNHHIQRDTLDVDLDAGTYPCTATFFACDPQTEEVVGQAAAQMTVVVNS